VEYGFAVSKQLNRDGLLDLFAQALCHSALAYRLSDMRAPHFARCAKICGAARFALKRLADSLAG